MSQKFLEVWVTTLDAGNNELVHMRQRIVACNRILFLPMPQRRARKGRGRKEESGAVKNRERSFALCLCGSKQRELRTLRRLDARHRLRARSRDRSRGQRRFCD